MPVKLYVEKPVAWEDTYQLAELTDITYRRMRNRGYARRHVEAVLPDAHSAMQLAAAKVIKSVPVGEHPVHHVNKRNLVVLRVGTMSSKRAMCLGNDGRVYSTMRGLLLEDGKFLPTAETLKAGFALFAVRKGRILTRVATLRPSLDYLS